ncbi:hypothetical protein [Nocardiopsis rhodophaea]|uniref:hypothetical protein n=1 Tax=Nocardiopsis rhodophaea TaxID=280238 RepID=UPI0031E32E9F
MVPNWRKPHSVIEDAAARVGRVRASLARIAGNARISKGAIFSYVDGKDDLWSCFGSVDACELGFYAASARSDRLLSAAAA